MLRSEKYLSQVHYRSHKQTKKIRGISIEKPIFSISQLVIVVTKTSKDRKPSQNTTNKHKPSKTTNKRPYTTTKQLQTSNEQPQTTK